LALNFFRWFQANFAVWLILSSIYSLTVTMVLQPILERVMKQEIPLSQLWASVCLALLVPGAFEYLSLPSIGIKLSRPIQGLSQIYLRHELRRANTWLVLILSFGLILLTPRELRPLIILAVQLSGQRALFSIYRWRGLALSFHPESGGQQLIFSLGRAQVIQFLILWTAVALTFHFEARALLAYGIGGLGAVIGSASMAMEGDSGKPWMVNFIALAAGIIAGFLCLSFPYLILLVGYFFLKMQANVAKRLKSVEHLDEDSLIP
jgi:hypothetical protein